MNASSLPSADRDRPGIFSLAQIQFLLKVEFGRGLRYGQPVMAMIVSVDGLSELFDRAGYAAKERALEQTLGLVQRETRPFDFVGRLTDDRLLVVVPQVRIQRADTLGKRLVRQAHGLRLVGGESAGSPGVGELRLSIGCGLMVSEVTLFHDELQSAAQAALTEAQSAGGDRCVVHEARGSSGGI